MPLGREFTIQGLSVSSLEAGFASQGGLGFPKPLEYTNSLPYQLFGLSGLTDPLQDGLNVSSSLVLNAAFGQLTPLSSFCFLLHWFFSSLSSVFLSGRPLCSLFMALKLIELMTV